MGHHYVPQKYIRGFSGADPDKIWMYDKIKSRFSEAGIAKIAQEKEFFEPHIEVELNVSVEVPANPVIEKLRHREAISADERAQLAIYIAVMLMRVPERRKRALDRYPGVAEDTIQRTKREIENIGATTDIDPEIVSRRLKEVENAREMLLRQPPTALMEQVRSPWPTEDVASAIYSMTWRYLVAGGGPLYFLTTDNPVFFFGAYGLGSEESELSFPIARDVCLLGNWQIGRDSESFIEVNQAMVKEMNRRNASTATRFIFYHEPASWINKLAHKQGPYLSRILWRQ